MAFRTEEGTLIPAVTVQQMREVDRVAVEEFGLGILQMMENAGRSLAENVFDMLGGTRSEVTVLAGAGGNGGGGLCCARHLRNRGVDVRVVLDRPPDVVQGAAANQLQILKAAGVEPIDAARAERFVSQSALVVDALAGYGLKGAPRGATASLIELCNRCGSRVLSLDVPSGIDATTGDAAGAAVRPERTLTLALPKTGLARVGGDLYLADIGIPPVLFRRIGLTVASVFGPRFWLRLTIDEATDRSGDTIGTAKEEPTDGARRIVA